MTYSNPYSIPSTTTNFIPFSGMGMRKNGRAMLLPSNYQGDGSTLDLDFTTMGGVLDPRLTFSRASTATFVNSQGYVENAGANLLLQGSNLGNATNWFGNGLTSRNASTDPNGLNEAVELNEDVTNTVHCVIQVTSQNLNGLVYTSTVYMKAGTNRTIGFIRDNNVSSDAVVFYTLTGSGSTNIANGSYGISASISSVGAGWYRCVFTIKAISTANVTIGTAKGTAYGDWSFAGTVGNSIHVWGAQLNRGSTAQTYYPTTTATYHAPRFDYSPTNIGEPRGLLVEGQAQNALFYSQDVTQASRWTIQAFGSGSYTTVSTTGGTAPDNTNTANLLTEGTGSFSRSIYQAVSMAIGTHTASLFVKAGSGNARYIRLVLASAAGNFVYVTVNLANGAVTQTAAAVGTATAASAIVTPYTGGWYRISLTGTFTAATNFCFIVPSDSATPAVNAGDYGRYDYVGTTASFSLWGCQVEADSGASSYIPTGASQVTRNADSCAMFGTNFSSWFNSVEGTFFFAFQTTYSGNTPAGSLLLALNSDGSKRVIYLPTASNLVASYDGTSIVFAVGTATGVLARVASSYNQSNRSIVLNGGTVGTGSVAAGYSSAISIGIGVGGAVNAHFKQVKFYPTRLSDTQLQALTAP